VIRFKYIGDVVLTSVLCSTLKQTYPNAQVDFLIQDTSADLFVNHPHIDRVIALSSEQRNNPIKYWRTIRKITSENYALVVDAQSTTKSEFISLLARRRAICIGRRKRQRGFFFTHKVDASPQDGHKVEERLKLLTPLSDMGVDIKRHDTMIVNVPGVRKSQFRNQMQAMGVDFSQPVFAFLVTAKLEFKKWRQEYFEEVVDYCMRSFNAQIVLMAGSDAEREDVGTFARRLNSKRVYWQIETRSLMDLAALLANCDLYIGNEGGPRHIAHAVGVPSVSVFSPSAKKSEWLPSVSRLHQGVEWDDMVDNSQEEKARIHQTLEVGSDRYAELYHKITPQQVNEVINSVAEFVRIKKVS